MHDLHDVGRQAAEQVGIHYREFPQDGQWHETPVIGKGPQNVAGRIKLFTDGEGGQVRNWITDETLTFWAKRETSLDPVEREARRRRAEQLRAEAEQERSKGASEAVAKVKGLWGNSQPIEEHPYLNRKGVRSVSTVRQIETDKAREILGYTPKVGGEALGGPLLIVPIMVDGALSSCQLIAPDGRKYFIPDGILKGGYWSVGKFRDDGTILIAEGVATALTCHEATGHPVVAAMSSGNLLSATLALRSEYPTAKFIVCSDLGNGESHARRAAVESGAHLAVPNFPEWADGTDFNDLASQVGLEAVRDILQAATIPSPFPIGGGATGEDVSLALQDEADEPREAKKRQSQAGTLLELTDGLELFRDQNGDGFAFLEGQCVKLRSDKIKKYLSYCMYRACGKTPNAEALSQTVSTLEGIALFDRDELPLENRIAKHDAGFLYDLGDHRSVHITANSWNVIDSPPKFRRYKHQSVQVIPIRGGDATKVFDFINVGPDHRLLVLVTLVSYFIPGIPHPIFHPWGPQGSGKTSLFRVFKRLVDPSIVETLMCTNDRSRVIHALVTHYVPLFDNLSRLDGETSDLLCQACTGGGIEQRQLFTDDESIIFQVLRCVGINGINLSIAKPDLLDRTLLLHLDRIDPGKRREESVLWGEFEEARPYILGGIFDLLSKAIAIYPAVKLEQLPRLADFGRWGYAVAEAFGPGRGQQFIADYQGNVDKQAEEVIQGNTLAMAILSHMETRDTWKTTVGEAFQTLRLVANPDRNDKSFPSTPKDLRRHLERLKSTLEEKGVFYTIGERTSEGYPIAFSRRPDFGSSGSSGSFASSTPLVMTPNDEPHEANEAKSAGCGVDADLPEFDFGGEV